MCIQNYVNFINMLLVVHTLDAMSAASSLELKFSSSYSISLSKDIDLLNIKISEHFT